MTPVQKTVELWWKFPMILSRGRSFTWGITGYKLKKVNHIATLVPMDPCISLVKPKPTADFIYNFKNQMTVRYKHNKKIYLNYFRNQHIGFYETKLKSRTLEKAGYSRQGWRIKIFSDKISSQKITAYRPEIPVVDHYYEAVSDVCPLFSSFDLYKTSDTAGQPRQTCGFGSRSWYGH